ncbi:ester cyclase [candidate division KSB1 bacterium]|nr:ester cyclase [candidate division KSB1 bacterium]
MIKPVNSLGKYFIILILSTLFLSISCRRSASYDKMKPLIEEYVKVWNTGNVESLNELTDPQFKLCMPPDYVVISGRDSLKSVIRDTRKSFPDFFIVIQDEILSSDKGLAVNWTITATHNGRKIISNGFSVITFSEGRITGEWIAYSDLKWIRQMGFTIIPPKEQLE